MRFWFVFHVWICVYSQVWFVLYSENHLIIRKVESSAPEFLQELLLEFKTSPNTLSASTKLPWTADTILLFFWNRPFIFFPWRGAGVLLLSHRVQEQSWGIWLLGFWHRAHFAQVYWLNWDNETLWEMGMTVRAEEFKVHEIAQFGDKMCNSCSLYLSKPHLTEMFIHYSFHHWLLPWSNPYPGCSLLVEHSIFHLPYW